MDWLDLLAVQGTLKNLLQHHSTKVSILHHSAFFWSNSHIHNGEGNGNPLQCSCLENPRDGGAWWVAGYGVAQSRTRLKRLSSSMVCCTLIRTQWCWRRFLRVPWTARRSNQSILKEISPECSLEGMMLRLKLQYFGHLMPRSAAAAAAKSH